MRGALSALVSAVVAHACCLGSVSARIDYAQPVITEWSGNPIEGCTWQKCSQYTTEKTCGHVSKNGKKTWGDVSCCRWMEEPPTGVAPYCEPRPCSFWNKRNCNRAPHCGWNYLTDGDDKATAIGVCNERAGGGIPKPSTLNLDGCKSMWKKTCDQYYAFCRWDKNAAFTSAKPNDPPGACVSLNYPTKGCPAGSSGLCSIPSGSTVGVNGKGCAGRNKKSCRWWQNKQGENMCTWSDAANECLTTAYANANCKWDKKENCLQAKKAGNPCKWTKGGTNVKAGKCVVYVELACYDLVGDTIDNAMTELQAQQSCCADNQIGDKIRGGTGNVKCKTPKLGPNRNNDCRWCQNQEDSPRCVKAKNCPFNANN